MLVVDRVDYLFHLDQGGQSIAGDVIAIIGPSETKDADHCIVVAFGQHLIEALLSGEHECDFLREKALENLFGFSYRVVDFHLGVAQLKGGFGGGGGG